MSSKKTTANLDDFLKDLEKDFGKGVMISALTKESYGDVIPSTSYSFNSASGIGGIAKGKIYDIYAEPSSGKSSLAYDLIANCQKKYGDYCLLVDKEDSYTQEYGAMFGIDNEKLILINNKSEKIDSLEDMYNIVSKALELNKFGIIIVDSVTSFAPKARLEDSSILGIEARVNSDKMRKINNLIPKSNTALLLLRQSRLSMGGFGNPVTTSGGLAIAFYSHVRIWLTRSKIDPETGQNIVKFNFVKNKLGLPYKIGQCIYDWNKGFDINSEMISIAELAGIITKKGNTYSLPEVSEDVKITGKKKLNEFLENNPNYIEDIIKPRVEFWLMTNSEIVDDTETSDE